MRLIDNDERCRTCQIRLIFYVITYFVGYVCSEPCGDTQECQHHHLTHCHMHTHIVCNSGQCECSSGSTGTSCTQLSDCSSVTCRDNNDSAHCVDGSCHCTRRPGGQGGN
ncbi:uncharacterized protein LOC132755349 [Ruditapes philippinarum]|uniref:uncharacterized protein LOC132755349 n=1 Tax=Ruditapes philippinarum TaxID=129788 RepID=UPI00295B1771|nr:uncharacterized protein LOC132755349 [Ruditapes philippinarum]